MILVTGATGIVGSHIVAELIRQGYSNIRVLSRLGSSREAIVQRVRVEGLDADGLAFATGDLLDPVSLNHAVRGCDEVYHCAALVSFSRRDTAKLYDTNTRGTANVVNACLQHGVEKLCYISSTASIGDERIDGMFAENSAWSTDKGRSHYALSKRYAEFEVLRGREEGLKGVIVNPSVVIGPGRWGESSTKLIVSCRNGMVFAPPGGNAFVDARDIARFCVQGMKDRWFDGRFLLVSENLLFRDLFTMVCEAFGSGPPRITVPEIPVKWIGSMVAVLESLGIPLTLTSENFKSAARQAFYSNERARSMGFVFTPVSEAVSQTVGRFLVEKGGPS